MLEKLNLKVRFGLSKLPYFPVTYGLTVPGMSPVTFKWSCVMPFLEPGTSAFDFRLYGWDVPELRFLWRYLSPGMVFLDIGAYHGLYSVLAAMKLAGSGRVIAFEPNPRDCARIRRHAASNQCKAVEILPIALYSRQGRATLHVPLAGAKTISSLRRPHLGADKFATLEIETETLDDICRQRQIDRIDVVKLDVEGAEADVLAGAWHVLHGLRPIWIFEALDVTAGAWGARALDLIRLFESAGYEILEFLPSGRLVPHAKRETYCLQSNCNLVAVPANRREAIGPHLAAPLH